MSARPDVWRIADTLQQTLRAASAQLVELRAQLAALDIPDTIRVACEACGLTFRGPASLSEHLYVSHSGPLPEHWLRADDLAERDAIEAL